MEQPSQNPEMSKQQALEIFPMNKAEAWVPSAISGLAIFSVTTLIFTAHRMGEVNTYDALVEEIDEPPQHILAKQDIAQDIYFCDAVLSVFLMASVVSAMGYKAFRNGKRQKKVKEYQRVNATPHIEE